MDLTCCKKYDKRDHLKKVGMPVRNGMDQLTVASCVWHFDYFNAVLGGSSKHMPAGYANVSWCVPRVWLRARKDDKTGGKGAVQPQWRPAA